MTNTRTQSPTLPRFRFVALDDVANNLWAKNTIWALAVLLAGSQILIGSFMPQTASASRKSVFSSLFGAKSASAAVIIAPKLNADGKTTTLAEQPTISDVPANPKSGNDLADAKTVMLSQGKPFYAPEDISFDNPVNAEKKWAVYEPSIRLSSALQARYNRLTDTFLCNYCCGEPMDVTRNRLCGCAHAKAARGYFKYMLQTYGGQYTDEQLMGEGYRWQAIWYPKGAVADYLLAIGKSSALPHQPHGGAGADGLHGLAKR